MTTGEPPPMLFLSCFCRGVLSHPDPDPTRLADPNRVRGARLSTGTLIDRFYLRAELVPVGIQTISVIEKNHLHIYKGTTIEVVSIKICTHILSLIFLYIYISTTKHQRSQKQCGEHLSMNWPALLMWDVLSSILIF